MDIPNKPQTNNCFIDYDTEKIHLWYKRFGHVNYQSLSQMSNKIINGLDIDKINTSKFRISDKCETCVLWFCPNQ